MVGGKKIIYYSVHSDTALLRGSSMLQKNEYENYIKDIYQEIPRLWDDLDPLPLKNAVKHLFTTGKRLRPILAIISCESVGGNYKDVLEFIPNPNHFFYISGITVGPPTPTPPSNPHLGSFGLGEISLGIAAAVVVASIGFHSLYRRRYHA